MPALLFIIPTGESGIRPGVPTNREVGVVAPRRPGVMFNARAGVLISSMNSIAFLRADSCVTNKREAALSTPTPPG